jgi:hypothetical protein
LPKFGPCGRSKVRQPQGEARHKTRQWPTVAPLWPTLEFGGVMAEQRSPVDPNRLTPEQAAKLLSAAAKIRVPVERIQEDIEAGAPRNVDGTINLMHYAAWMVKEMGRGN